MGARLHPAVRSPPNVVNKSRGRYRQSGAKDDQWDAALIGNLLRTDRQRFRPWHPGSALLQPMRASVSYHLYLTKQAVATGNRLRALLLRYYPAAYHFCSTWPSRSACRLIRTYPDPAQATALSAEAFQAFLAQIRFPRRKQWLTDYRRL